MYIHLHNVPTSETRIPVRLDQTHVSALHVLTYLWPAWSYSDSWTFFPPRAYLTQEAITAIPLPLVDVTVCVRDRKRLSLPSDRGGPSSHSVRPAVHQPPFPPFFLPLSVILPHPYHLGSKNTHEAVLNLKSSIHCTAAFEAYEAGNDGVAHYIPLLLNEDHIKMQVGSHHKWPPD